MAYSTTDIQTILQFFMEQLPEDKLAELDARIDGSASENPAMDAALAKRGQWLALDSHTRQAIRESKRHGQAQDAQNAARFKEMFPHADRIKHGY